MKAQTIEIDGEPTLDDDGCIEVSLTPDDVDELKQLCDAAQLTEIVMWRAHVERIARVWAQSTRDRDAIEKMAKLFEAAAVAIRAAAEGV